MQIRLHPPFGIHDQGRRENNEDCIYPRAEDGFATDRNRLFLVCDGVGGLEKGEVASKIVCETLWDTLRHEEVIQGNEINAAIKMAEQRIDQYITSNLEAQGMATTLTLLALHEQGATVAHIGDSRVYQFREGQCIFKTRDHSLINDLISKDIITAEEALNHPKRNVITKAISGFADHQVADIKLITDVQAGDYFFLCTDGIQEAFSDEELIHLFGTKFSNADKVKFIKTKCKKESKDNFSAYLIQIKSVADEKAMTPLAAWETIKEGKFNKPFVTLMAIATGIAILILINSISAKNAEQVEQANIESALEILQDIDTMELAPAPAENLELEKKAASANEPSKSKGKTRARKKSSQIRKMPEPKDSLLDELLEMDSYGFEEAQDLSYIKKSPANVAKSDKATENINPSQIEDDLFTKMDSSRINKESIKVDSIPKNNIR